MNRIAAVIPTLNEADELPATLAHVRAVPEICECLVVDGGSSDATRFLAEGSGCRVLSTRAGRGNQLRIGAQQTQCEIVLLLHADTWLPENAGRAVLTALEDPAVVGGGFWKIFRNPHWLMRGSRLRCWTRLHWFGRVAGDQAMFVRRSVLERVGGVPAMPLMEEFELCRRLRQVGRLVLVPATVATSARRWHRDGVLTTYSRMWRIVLLYYLGWSASDLARTYNSKSGK